MEKMEAKKLCSDHMNKYVLIQTKDGAHYDGIVESVDEEHVYLAVPNVSADAMQSQHRAYGLGYPYPVYPQYGYQYPGVGFPYGYGYGYGGRFRRLVLPLAALAAISLLPYF